MASTSSNSLSQPPPPPLPPPQPPSASILENNMKVVLKSNDNEYFEVDMEVASMSLMLKHMIEEGMTDTIPLPNVSSKTLAKVLEYCHKHVYPNGNIVDWDNNFVNGHHSDLFAILQAADYLIIQSLIDLTSTAIAEYIKDKSVETVRRVFNIKNDFTPEEEMRIRKENEWAFDNVNVTNGDE